MLGAQAFMYAFCPPSKNDVLAIRSEFASRPGLSSIDCRVPYVPQEERYKNDYKNYKDWTSILTVAFVNSFVLHVRWR